jgi:hypothetical protein
MKDIVCKSNYHTITTMTIPANILSFIDGKKNVIYAAPAGCCKLFIKWLRDLLNMTT